MNDVARKCIHGHTKELRKRGWYCAVCANIQQKARYDRIYAAQPEPRKPRGVRNVSRATPTGDLCMRGHARVQRPGGFKVCPTCHNAQKVRRRAAMRSVSCEHVDEEGFQGVINAKGQMVCLTCVAAEMAAS